MSRVGGEDRLLVLHAFQKQTERTPRADLDLARKRLRDYRRPA
ncbi:MAG: type II toxin-antitoxin system RelE/ParE family toxin [Pseudomonadota bacterium]|nr:type II toxin-antitoxin system RelE/ParE family toxin [Pseudomonadota bacterium]